MKKRGMKKRVLAALMTACMVVGSVPGVSLADVETSHSKALGINNPGPNKFMLDGNDYTTGTPDIELNKTATYNSEDGTYTIQLNAKTSDKLTKKKTHVVFLVDASGSMNFCEENATEMAIPDWLVLDKTKHIHYYWDGILTGGYKSGCTKKDANSSVKSRVTIATEAIAKMTENLGTENVTYDYTWFNDNTGSMDNVSDLQTKLSAKDGTYLKEGVEYALTKFNNDEDNENQILVILADGKSDSSKKILICNKNHHHYKTCYKTVDNYYPKEEIENSKFAKNNGKVYTIGFAFNSPDFDNLSNGEGYHFNASDEASLKNASEQISQKLKPEIVDNIGSNVEYVSGSVSSDNCSVSVTNDETTGTTITWSNLAELSSGITVSYKVKVINSDFGSKKLNGDAAFNCIYKGERKTFPFPMPSVEGAKLTVNFVNENNNPIEMEGNWIDWIGLTSSGVEFRNIKEIPNTFTSMDGKTYYLKSVADPSQITNYSETTNTYAISSPTEAKEYVVTVTVTENIPQPETYTVIYDANGGAWDCSFSKDGYNLNATSGADKLTKENARGEETLELLNGNELPTRENYDFDGWYLDGKKLTSEMTVAAAADTRTEVVVEAHWTEKKPEVPSKPKDTEIVPEVIVECLNASNSGHGAKRYYVNIPNSYEIGEVRLDGEKYVSTVTVFGVYYAEKYNADVVYDHVLTTVDDITYDLTWNADTKTWEAPALTRIPTIKVDCSKDTPSTTDPELPGFRELEDLIEGVVLVHTGSNAASHPDEEYTLMEDGYEISWYGTTKAILTVKAAPYVNEYIAAHGNHDVKGAASAKLILARTDGGWDIEEGTTPIRFFVKCTENNPEKPALPKYDDLKKLFGETINVTCETDEQHAPQSFGLMAGTYSVTRDKEDDKEAVVTVFAKDYIKAYADGKHTNAGDDAATVKLFYDEEDGKWYSENQEIVINFKAKCEKTPEKQYTEIKFVVVNGTFTENGQTELTKTFEVGTKLTLADIPASKGKSSSYSDQTWDKFPVGYVVGKDGTTFTITYRWRSSGSDSDDSDYDYGTSTRGKATNAAGKSGRWILEGGEFTEDNGRLPSNEYLKIGDTIYGFYTYGFAIDFDRPEYYTDAAIQAKGGYRDATGTWRLNGWWFCYDDGTFPHDEWVYLTWNGRSDWYYFDVDGWMEDGWLYRNNNWYYLHTQYDNTRGRMYTGWHEIDGKWYYFNTASDKETLGAMLANTTTPDGYQVDANGAWIR